MAKLEKVGIPVMPAIPWDTTLYNRKLEGGFIASLLGLGEILKLYRMWDGSDEQIEAIMEFVERGLRALMTDACCDDAIVALRKNRAGYLVGTTAGGATTLIENTTTLADLENMPEEQALDNANDNVCAGVKLLSERFWNDVMYTLDQADFVAQQVKLASEALSAILTSIPAVGATAGVLYDGWSEFLTQAATLGISALKLAFSDPAVRLKFEENLYCAIIENDNTLTSEIFFASTEDLPLGASQSSLLEYFMEGFNINPLGTIFGTVLRWYNLGALSEDPTCDAEFACTNEWVCEWLSGDGKGDWVVSTAWSYGTYDAVNDRWNSQVSSGVITDIGIQLTIPEGCTVHSISYESELNFTAASSRSNSINWKPAVGSETVLVNTFRTGSGTYNQAIDEQELTNGIVRLYNGAYGSGSYSRITKITMTGVGTPPCTE